MTNDNDAESKDSNGSTSKSLCTDSSDEPVAVYTRRWLMLALLCCFTGLSAHNSLYFSTIPDVLVKYYNLKGDKMVDYLSLVYLGIYVPCIFPVIWLIENKGLRPTLLFGTFGTTVGAWIKVAIFGRNHYWALFIGQTITAVCQVSFLSIPVPLAATWFPDNEVATATAFGICGNMVGASLGFLLSPLLVPYLHNIDTMGWYLRLMLIEIAVASTILFLLILFFFQNKPPRHPSLAQYALIKSEAPSMMKSMTSLLRDTNFCLLLLSYGITWGAYNTISILLGQVVHASYENAHEHSGYIGLTMATSGLPSILLFGYILDKTKRFKLIICTSSALMLVSTLIYTFSMGFGNIWVAYVTIAILGFFLTGYLPVGMEYAAEVMYPEPENYTSALLNCSSMILGIIFVLCGEQLKSLSILGTNLFISSTYLVGAIVTLFLEEDLKRHSKSQGLEGYSEVTQAANTPLKSP